MSEIVAGSGQGGEQTELHRIEIGRRLTSKNRAVDTDTQLSASIDFFYIYA